jgi:O-antigen/teichoic acid export membrane protein
LNFFSRGYTKIVRNFFHTSILELIVVIVPLILYPYLIKNLGVENYGLLITAHLVGGYYVILVNFGFRRIGPKGVAIRRSNSNELSEYISAVFLLRIIFWLIALLISVILINLVPVMSENKILFLLAFGLTLNELLFPQFYYQGLEKMKFITYLYALMQGIYVVLVLLFVKHPEDLRLVLIFKIITFILVGILNGYIIFIKDSVRLMLPSKNYVVLILRESAPLFTTDIIASIKDKSVYFFVAGFLGSGELVIFDLGIKFTNFLSKFGSILGRVLLPRIATERNIKLAFNSLVINLFLTACIVILVGVYMPEILDFLGIGLTHVFLLRIFLVAPLILSISAVLATNFLVAFNESNRLLSSIIATSVSTVIMLVLVYGNSNYIGLQTFVWVTIIAYVIEMLYRTYWSYKIYSNEKS